MLKKACLGLALLLAHGMGCGYQVVRGDQLFGLERIAVLPFYETSAMGMAQDMALHLGRMLEASGMPITPQRDAAAAVLDGTLTFSTLPSASRAGISTYQVVANVHAELTDKSGTLLWRTDTQLREEFLPVSGQDIQPLLTETHRRTAVRRLAEKAAVLVHEALVVGAAAPQVPG